MAVFRNTVHAALLCAALMAVCASPGVRAQTSESLHGDFAGTL
jgi:hypothetical protein